MKEFQFVSLSTDEIIRTYHADSERDFAVREFDPFWDSRRREGIVGSA